MVNHSKNGKNNISNENSKTRDRLSFYCRFQAESQSQVGLILWYLDKVSINKRGLVTEFLRYAYYVRALKLASREGYDPGFLEDRQYRKEEAIRGIFYFWGLIEALCVAADIPPEAIANRLGGNGGDSKSGSNDLKVSQLASLMINEIEEQERNGEPVSRDEDKGKNGIAVEKDDNMNTVSSLFGN